MAQHLQIWDYISVSGSKENRMIEYWDRFTEHFKYPRKMKNCRYPAPQVRISTLKFYFLFVIWFKIYKIKSNSKLKFLGF